MNLLLSTRIALRALAMNKLRAALTVLGIVIGVAAVIALISVGQGARKQITDNVHLLGTNLLFVRPSPGQPVTKRQPTGAQPTLTYEEALAISRADYPSIVAVTAEVTNAGLVDVGGLTWYTRLSGTTTNYPQVRNFTIAQGRFFDQRDFDTKARVVVLGPTVVSKVFANRDPIDQTVAISLNGNPGDRYRVVGVTQAKGVTGFSSEDDQIILPLSTMQQRLLGLGSSWSHQDVSVIDVEVTSPDQMSQTAAEIGALLRERHHLTQDDFRVTSEADVLQFLDEVTSILTLVLGAIAGISLLVGGIGIMNIMLVSVTERTREIGIRRAIGARQRDILYQFLVEAVVVTLGGGIVGVGLGIIIAQFLSQVPVNGRYLQTVVLPESILLAMGVSVSIGLFFGFFPAVRAAGLRPIEALRHE